MFCRNCGKEIKDTEKFCSYCGTPVDIHENNSDKQDNLQRKDVYTDNFNAGVSLKKNKHWSKKIIIGIITVIILIIIIGLFGADDSDDSANESYSVSSGKNVDGDIMQFNLNIVNYTGMDIYELCASRSEDDKWGNDILGDTILYDGESTNVTFTINSKDMDWDFVIEDMDGNQYEYYGVNFVGCDTISTTLFLYEDGEATVN